MKFQKHAAVLAAASLFSFVGTGATGWEVFLDAGSGSVSACVEVAGGGPAGEETLSGPGMGTGYLGDAGVLEKGHEDGGIALGTSSLPEPLPGTGIGPERVYLLKREVRICEGGRKLLETDLEEG